MCNNKKCDPNGWKSIALWEWSRMHIAEHVSVLWFASITFLFFGRGAVGGWGGGGGGLQQQILSKQESLCWIAHVTLWQPNRNERLSFVTYLRYSYSRRRCRYLIFYNDFSFVDWRIETFASFCLWIPCTGRLVAQCFRFLSLARLNMHICCGHRIHSAFGDQGS